MVEFSPALLALEGPALARALKGELEGLGAGDLPLQQAVTQGGLAGGRDLSVTVLDVGRDRDRGRIRARVGVFFTELVGGCSCGEDPVEENAYCELRLSIDPETGEAGIEVIGS